MNFTGQILKMIEHLKQFRFTTHKEIVDESIRYAEEEEIEIDRIDYKGISLREYKNTGLQKTLEKIRKNKKK